MSDERLRHSPLDAEHRALGARMVPFGGWEMPIQYAGVLEEHRACRERAVVFDVSHLGSVRVRGTGAQAALQWALTNDLGRIGPGRAQYTHLVDPVDAHVVDDIIVWWLAPDDFIVMPNASNTEPLVHALHEAVRDHGGGAATVEDVTAIRGVLAVQGPDARALLAPVIPEAATVPRFGVVPIRWDGHDGWIAGTGYTGEDGVEVHVPASVGPSLWRAVLDAGIPPAGLGARDTLRLEAGLPLHGHELGPGITPLQAGLGWVVRVDKPGGCRGDGPLREEAARGPARVLRGLRIEGRRPPREGCDVLRDGEVVGRVTSGNFSPVLGCGIALALCAPGVTAGDAIEVDVRGSRLAGEVVGLPFVAAGGRGAPTA